MSKDDDRDETRRKANAGVNPNTPTAVGGDGRKAAAKRPAKKRAPRKRAAKKAAPPHASLPTAEPNTAAAEQPPVGAASAATAGAAHAIDARVEVAAVPVAAEAALTAAAVPVAAEAAPTAAAVPTASTRRLLLDTTLDVRWGDMDAFNHVNNARFLSYLEEARLRWLQTLNGPWLDEHTAPVLAAVNVNYRRPIEWPATLGIELHAERVGSSSVTLGHRIVDRRDASILYSDGHVVMVWIDRRSGRGSKLPTAVRQAVAAGTA